MSSRFPSSGRGDTRYAPRDRSLPRYPDRRSSGAHVGAPVSARGNNDFYYRANDTYAHSTPRREPPRGPKAFGAGPGRGYGPRSRGFRGRGDGVAREYRDARDISAGRREQDYRDWAWRERDPSRERRPSPVGRNRSRSPAPRDFRDSRDFGPRDIEDQRSRRSSREGIAQPSPAASEPSVSAGPGNRGGFFGRGRPDRDYNRRSRGSFGEDREPFQVRTRSRERPWERRSTDDRDRDWVSNPTRRDEKRDERREWDDKDPEVGRAARDPFTNRLEPGGTISARSASTSPPPKYRYSSIRPSHEARGSDTNSNPRPSNTSTDPSEALPSEGSQRLGVGVVSNYQGRELPPQRASSPPQAPQVPAFGSIVYQKPSTNPSNETPAQNNDNAMLPELLQPPQSLANVPSAPKAQLMNTLPTGPKADQNSGRRPIPDTVTASNRWTDGRGSILPGSSHGPISEGLSVQTGSGERISVATKDFRPGQPPQQTPFSRAANFVSPIKVSDDMNRYSGNPTNFGVGNPGRSSVQEPPTQSSPIRIPTGPRADRAAPASKLPISSPGRPSPGRPTMLQRPSRGTNLRWVRPGLPTHTPRGPSIMSPMAVKKDYAEDDPTDSPDGESEEQESTVVPASSVTIQPPSSKVISSDQAKIELLGPILVERQNEQLLPMEFRGEAKTSEPEMTLMDHGNVEEKDTVMEDEHMDLDEEYLADERKFQHQIQLLETKRPASPRQNPKLLSLLDEIDALSSAAEDRANGRAVQQIMQEPTDKARLNAYPSPKIVEDDPFQDDPIHSHQEVLRNATPPIDSLPYLMSGPPTPFSEVDLQDEFDLQEILDAQLMDELTSRLRLESNDQEEVKEQFYQDYKAWRLAIEDWEDRKAATAPSVPVTPAPMSTPLIPSMPITEGRRSARNVSELDFERALRDSIVIHDEEQQRRELEAKSSINPEKEAIIPDMLNENEMRTQNLMDTTNLIQSSDAYRVFGYVPKPNDFTAEEQEIYTEAFLTNPKKFGVIAKALPNRTYQDCIQHYYLTKHDSQYKDKLAIRLKKGRRAPARSTGRPRGGAPSLLSNAMVDEKHQIEVTDTGRPRRAAAPTFGDTTEPEASTPAVTPGRRNMSGTKADGSEANPEKPPTRRGRGGTTREKVPRKPKAQLLAAAPGPSPQKIEKETPRGKSKEPKIEIEQQIDEFEAGELLANLQHNQNVPTFTQQPVNEIWTGGQSLPVSSASQIQVAKPEFTAQEQLQSQQRAGPSTSSYWSVPEQTDFSNLLHHFGTNWQAIADHMKTKTQTMVKNYYHRQVERGDRRAMEEAAIAANEKIKRGEDMGQPPPPTLVPKRRYDTGPQIVPPRPLAPSIEANEANRESSNLQPTKPMKFSPPQVGSSPQKLSALAQAEPLPRKLLLENDTQTTSGSAIRPETQPQQQRASQGLHGPRVGFFDDRSRPMLQPQPAAVSQLQQPPPTRQQPQADSRSHKPVTDQTRLRNLQEMLQIQDRSKSEDQSPSTKYQQPAQTHQQPLLHQGAGNNRQINVPSQVRIAPSHTAEVDIRPRAAAHQQSQSRHPSHHDQRQEQQRMDNPSTTRRPDAYVAPRHTLLQSPVKSRLPSNFSPLQDPVRPSSVAAPPPAQQPPKRSNIMSILNDEPAEPQARKRVSDNRPAAPTPPPQSPAGQAYHQPVQQYVLRETPTTEPQHPLQQYHQRHSIGQIVSQHPSQQPREGPSNWASVAQRTSLERQPNYQQQRAESPRLQPTYTQQASRAPLPSIPRSHAPTPPPPFGHSRASSFASLHSQQAQQQPQPSSQATPVLQPSPYAQIHPQQPMHPHHQHQHSQHQHQHPTQQAATQPQQQQSRWSGAPSLFHHQYMRHQEALQQQQQQHQHQQGASLPRQPETSRPDILQYQDNLRMVQARNQANEQARRDEAVRRTFTPPVYGRHGGYGPPQDGHPRGYEDRR